MTDQRNPECVQGKHPNCDGTAWDEATDQPTDCLCNCHIEVHTVACMGGCGKVYDFPEPHPFYICNRCRTFNRV